MEAFKGNLSIQNKQQFDCSRTDSEVKSVAGVFKS